MGEDQSGRYRLTLTGTPGLTGPDGRTVGSLIAQPKRLALLAYLVLAGKPVPRSHLLPLFWPGRDESRARNSLNQAVFYLRRSLDAHTVVSADPDAIGVAPDRIWCDAVEILGKPDDHQTVVRLFGGDFLEGWTSDGSNDLDDWLDRTRWGLENAFVGAALSVAEETAGDDPDASAAWALRAGDVRPVRRGGGAAGGGGVALSRPSGARSRADRPARSSPGG